MKIIQARFIGQSGLGYITGKTYKLRVWYGRRAGLVNALMFNINVEYPILIARATDEREYDGGGLCPYQNIVSFFNNWTDIKTI